MAAAVLSSHQDKMPSYNNSIDMEDVHTPASDFQTFNQGTMFSFPQTGPADLCGSSWDATVEGSQNFHAEFSDNGEIQTGDAEEYSFAYGHITPRRDGPEMADDFQSTWAVGPSVETSLSNAEPMRRMASQSSTGSHKHRTLKASSIKGRPRLQSTLSQSSAQLASFDMAGNAVVFPDGYIANGRIMDVNQYLAPDLDTLSVSSYPGFATGFTTDGLPHDFTTALTQHVDPTCTQMRMDYEPSLASHSIHSWDSSISDQSRTSSPVTLEDAWRRPNATSPTDTHTSSPSFGGHSPSGVVMSAPGDEFALPTGAFSARRPSNEGETARDHPLYKTATPKSDGLFHCPWEGQPSCNHKPEKLKCNYDKFVDSHLKPYRCKVESCENTRFSSTACLLRHEREAHAMHGHGDKPYLCTYEGCDRAIAGNGFPRQWNLRDHMKRVHHDKGTAVQATSPPASGSSQNQAKGRKRKKDAPETGSNRRKSSSKTRAAEESLAASQAEDVAMALYNEWNGYHKAFAGMVQSFPQPDDPAVLRTIQEAQTQLSEMTRISTQLLSTHKPELLQGVYQRAFVQHTG